MRSRAWLYMLLLIVALPLLVIACAPSDEGESAGDSATVVEDEPELEIPEAEKNRPNPVARSADSLASGKRTFSNMCTPCHGMEADGSGELAKHLKVEVPDFNDPEEQARFTDGELFYILTNGHGAMPAQEDRLTDEIKWSLINYIRTFGEE
jgi:mono/diheme cytochrome c family protein